MLSHAILLGPQRHVKLVRDAVATLVPAQDRRPLATVTAGWEEREAEHGELREHVEREVKNLEVWARVERVFAEDPELFEAMRQRHDTLRRVQALYRLRLQGLLDPLRELDRRTDPPELLAPERDAAMDMVRELDAQHVQRVAVIHREFEARWRPAERAAVVREKKAIEKLLGDASCLLIAGGHVGVLLHRLRLFGLFALWGNRPVVAWSAGAMVLCERIVLFHDFPPEGSHHPEVMEAGFGLVPGFVAFPHAEKRLDFADLFAMRTLARRFDPAFCGLLEKGARFDWNGRIWEARGTSRTLEIDGSAREVTA